MTLRSQLGRVRRSVGAAVSYARDPLPVPPGHFYSPIPSRADLDRVVGKARREPVGIDVNAEAQLQLAGRLDLRTPDGDRWQPNDMFGNGDGAVLQAMLEHYRPGRVVEVGSGFSTAVMLDTADRVLPDLKVTCIEPYADRLRSRLRPGDAGRLELIERPVQDVPLERFADEVGAGDILFIDSTHVVKAGSDVHYLFLHVLPRLPVGAIVHVHDVFWPFEYPDDWHQLGRHWNEDYLLHAFLLHNQAWEILLFNAWLWHEHPEKLPAELRAHGTGSIWLRRKAA